MPGASITVKTGTGDEEPDGHPSRPSGTGLVVLAPAAHSQQHERRDHDGHPAGERGTGLDAYVAQLVDEAPPLSSEQRDTLALILRRPCRR